jgi:hypothetical protein
MHDSIYLYLVPKVVPFVFAWGGKDVILLNIRWKVIITLVWLVTSWLVPLVLLTSSRLCLRSSRELPSALLQLSHEPELMRGVGRFPARVLALS